MSVSDKGLVFILTSTTGNGNPPNHAISFKCALDEDLEDGARSLEGLKYSVFAFGSSIYENFCTFGKFCDASIEEAGGIRISPLLMGDEQKGQVNILKVIFFHDKYVIGKHI